MAADSAAVMEERIVERTEAWTEATCDVNHTHGFHSRQGARGGRPHGSLETASGVHGRSCGTEGCAHTVRHGTRSLTKHSESELHS